MTDERPSSISPRNVWEAIDSLRSETREARHAQGNLTQTAIASLRSEMDTRLRAIEHTIASSNPTSLGPRINELERWQSRADADEPGGLPARIAALDSWKDQMSGVIRVLGLVATLSGILSAVLGVIAFARP